MTTRDTSDLERITIIEGFIDAAESKSPEEAGKILAQGIDSLHAEKAPAADAKDVQPADFMLAAEAIDLLRYDILEELDNIGIAGARKARLTSAISDAFSGTIELRQEERAAHSKGDADAPAAAPAG